MIRLHTTILFILVGDMIHVSFPMGSFTTSLLDSMDHVTLIAAGSGQFPWQIICRMLHDY